MPHLHIRWSTGPLDWQRFATRQQAELVADFLKQPSESYTIEEHDGVTCLHCLRAPIDNPETMRANLHLLAPQRFPVEH